MTIKQIAETVQELIGDVEIVYTPARPGDFGGKIVCSARAERELGWTAATPFPRACAATSTGGASRPPRPPSRRRQSVIPAGEPDAESRPRQVLIISADIGEGHDLPARAVAREFKDEDPDAQVSIVNGLPAMGAGPDQGPARELGVHVPLGAVAVRPAVPAVHVLRADAVAGHAGC